MSLGRRHTTSTCESCGKRTGHRLPFFAYRPIISNYGPWLIERLCGACVDQMRASVVWNVKLTYPMRQMSLPGLRVVR